MRKFNLKGTVIQRMKGITREETKPVTPEKEKEAAEPEMIPAFTTEQGEFLCVWRTDVGRLRKNNQDAVILGNGMAGVADGMGGHKGGEIASAGLRDALLRETKGCRPDSAKLEEAVSTANLELFERQKDDAALSGMGTTMTVLWPTEKEMIIGQIGDSRAYLLRGGELTQITNDHSMVADMVRKGVLTEEQAACHPLRNYITRAVATEETVKTDLSIHDRKRGDIWLVCSDGLYGMMTKTQLEETVKASEDLEETADKLLRTALDNGGKDNISLVLLKDNTVREAMEAEPEERMTESGKNEETAKTESPEKDAEGVTDK